MAKPLGQPRRSMPVRRRLLFVALMLCVIGACVELGGA
ncbi:MAG: hypothetical protein ACI85K_003649, partial [Hyphomicrobiaceae bacterium]